MYKHKPSLRWEMIMLLCPGAGLSLTRLHISKSLCPQPALVRRANPLWSVPESYPPANAPLASGLGCVPKLKLDYQGQS